MPGVDNQDLDNPQNLLAEGIIDRAQANEAAEKQRKVYAVFSYRACPSHLLLQYGLKVLWLSLSQLAILEKQYHDELKMEVEGTSYSSLSSKNLEKPSEDVEEDTTADTDNIEEHALNLAKVSMSRKKRGILEAIQVMIAIVFSFAHDQHISVY